MRTLEEVTSFLKRDAELQGMKDEIERLRIAVNDLSKENGQLREVLFKLDRVAEDSYGSPAYGSMASSFVQSIVSKALLGEE